MSRWMVNVRGNAFSAANMEELRQLAKRGDLSGGDIVQPPGASEWLYAVEIPELKASLRTDPMDGYDAGPASQGVSTVVKAAFAGVLVLASVGIWGYALSLKAAIPKPGSLQLLDEGGQNGMSFKEVLVTTETSLRAEASTTATEVGPLHKSAKAELLAKRGTWYKLRSEGKEGYAPVDTVVPAYFFADERTKLDYDPLYNPDKYLYIVNAGWELSADKAKKGVSNLTAMLQNDSKFGMTDIKIVATLKDPAGGQVRNQVEIAVEGVVPPNRSDMIGTLSPAKGDTSPPRVMLTSDFEKLVAEDPKAAERWADGVDVQINDEATSEASATVVEVRAVPPDEAGK